MVIIDISGYHIKMHGKQMMVGVFIDSLDVSGNLDVQGNSVFTVLI